jgi:F-type H+-transporting ATPase subunit b
MLYRFLLGVAVATAIESAAPVPRMALAADEQPVEAEHGAVEHDAADLDAAKHGAHEHIGHADAGAGLEQPNEVRSDLALFTLVVFLLLLAILWKFAWGPIVASLERREQAIANHIAEAERNHDEAKRLLGQYEQKLAAAASEVRELMDEARRDAEHAKQSILAEAKAEAEVERKRSLHEIETAADQAMESLARRAAQLSVDLAGRIMQSKLSSSEHARLIEEAVSNFPSSPHSSN